MIKAVKGLGLETCATLGLQRRSSQKTKRKWAQTNHNIDTSEAFYEKIINQMLKTELNP